MSEQFPTEAISLPVQACPFCGSQPSYNEIPPHEHSQMLKNMGVPDHKGSHVIECACGAGMIHETYAGVLAMWNRRSPHGASEQRPGSNPPPPAGPKPAPPPNPPSGAGTKPWAEPGREDAGKMVPLSDYRALYRAAVNIMECGRDRLKDFGCECDPLDVMEKGDPNLIRARKVIADATSSGEPSARCAVCDHLEELHAPFNLQHAFVAKSPAEPGTKLAQRLTAVRNRLLDRGDYDKSGADVVDATTIGEAIAALSGEPEAALSTMLMAQSTARLQRVHQLEQELRDARYMVGMLVHKAGGRVDLSPHDMVTLDPKAEMTHWDDPVGGHRIIELKSPSTKDGKP